MKFGSPILAGTPAGWGDVTKVLGRKYGYLGWVSLPSSTLARNRKSSFFVGYSGDFPSLEYQKYFTAGPGWTAGFEEGCGIVGEEASFSDRLLRLLSSPVVGHG